MNDRVGANGQGWSHVPLGLAVLMLAGLPLGCKREPKAPAVAAAPKPRGVMVASAEPLSAPQTAVRLPPAQPIPPEAIPPEPEARNPESAAEAGTGRPEPPKEAPRVRPTPPVSVPRPAAGPLAPPVRSNTNGAPQLRPLLTTEEEQELRRRIEQCLNFAEQTLTRVQPRRSKEQDASAERVRSFIEQAQQARKQGDLVRAKSLAERAELLASDLARTSK